MFDSKCRQVETKESNKISLKGLADIGMQTAMASSLVYVAYKLIYRPFVLGVDIVGYALVDIGMACLVYLVLNRLFGLMHNTCKETSLVALGVENVITYGLNLILAFKMGYSLYYSRSCFIFVCTLILVNIVLTCIGIKKRALGV